MKVFSMEETSQIIKRPVYMERLLPYVGMTIPKNY